MNIVVVSDASNYGIGIFIFHIFPDGNQKASHIQITDTGRA